MGGLQACVEGQRIGESTRPAAGLIDVTKVDCPALAPAIFAALHGRGFTGSDIGKAIGASPARFKSLSNGTYQLTDREMSLIEDLSNRTIGQLGMEGFEIHDPSLRKLMNAGAALRKAINDKPTSRRKRRA